MIVTAGRLGASATRSLRLAPSLLGESIDRHVPVGAPLSSSRLQAVRNLRSGRGPPTASNRDKTLPMKIHCGIAARICIVVLLSLRIEAEEVLLTRILSGFSQARDRLRSYSTEYTVTEISAESESYPGVNANKPRESLGTFSIDRETGRYRNEVDEHWQWHYNEKDWKPRPMAQASDGELFSRVLLTPMQTPEERPQGLIDAHDSRFETVFHPRFFFSNIDAGKQPFDEYLRDALEWDQVTAEAIDDTRFAITVVRGPERPGKGVKTEFIVDSELDWNVIEDRRYTASGRLIEETTREFEVKSGVAVLKAVQHEQYYDDSSKDPTKTVLLDVNVSSFEINPEFDPSHFRVDFPPNTRLRHNILNVEIVMGLDPDIVHDPVVATLAELPNISEERPATEERPESELAPSKTSGELSTVGPDGTAESDSAGKNYAWAAAIAALCCAGLIAKVMLSRRRTRDG